jgi:hypothetical protein
MSMKTLKFVFYVCTYEMYNVYFPISSVFVSPAVMDVHNLQCFLIILY